MDIDGVIIGPVASDVLTHLATKWQIGPDSLIRRGDSAEWVTFRDVAATIGIRLPDSTDWSASRKAAMAKQRSETMLVCVVLLVIGWIGMAWIGIGFLFVPILMSGILYFGLCKLFQAMSGIDIFSLPLLNDMRVNRLPGQGLQMLALALSGGLVMAYYAYRMMN